MDGQFFHDTRTPFIVADVAAVTLATTNKALIPASQLPVLGANYFGFVGKRVRLRGFGKITTAATPGNGQFAFYWGTGADANGTIIQSSTAAALTAAQTNLSFFFEVVITCRAVGASGSLMLTGWAMFNEGVLAAHQLIPASAAAATTVDLTANNVISPQFNRSGSTVETMALQEFTRIAEN